MALNITDIGLTMLKDIGLKTTYVIEEYNPHIEGNDNSYNFNFQVLIIKRNKRSQKKVNKFHKTYNERGINDDIYTTIGHIDLSPNKSYYSIISKRIIEPLVDEE